MGDTADMTPTLPPETRIRFWAPVVHYGLAAALFAAAVFHVDLHLSSLDQTIITCVAMLLVVAGTGVWIYFHHLGLKTFEVYLKSSVPGLLQDVHLLKQSVGTISPQSLDQMAKVVKRLDALEPLVMTLVQGHKPVPPEVAAVVDPAPVVAVVDAPVVPVDLATARAEVKAAAADLVTALEVETK